MKKILLILFSFLFLSSCNTLYKLTPAYWQLKSEFKKELELVQKILDNPEKMQEIIETSEFYDKNNFDMNNYPYKFFVDYFKSNKYGTVEISSFGWANLHIGPKKPTLIEKRKKIIVYKSDASYEIHFDFKYVNEKIMFTEIHCFFIK